MDHNLEDSLNLESAIGVDFDHSEEAVVSQADVTLDTSGHEEGIPMEFDNIEEQPMLMDTGNEEIIDFMESQFTLQELSVDSDQMTEPTTTVDSNEQEYTSQSEGMIDLQFEPPTISVSDVLPQDVQPKVVAIKTNSPALRQIAKKESIVLTKTTTVPRQVAIAPKPPTLGNSLKVFRQKATLMTGKQVNIMPKPVNSKSVSLVKKVSLATAMQANAKGNTVLAQVGKQFIMMPAGSGQKLKLITTGGAGGAPTVRLVSASESQSSQNVSSSQTNKPAIANVIIQDGKAIVGHPAVKTSQTTAPVITKMLPTTTTSGVQARYVTMTQKTVPISLEKKLLLSSSPTKPGVRLAKKPQMIAIKSPTPKLAPTSGTQGTTTKKVVITANPQNVILRTTAPPKTGQATKGNIGQRTQLHQINVPGKGIQYIRLVTNANASSASAKVSPKPVAAPSKTFVLADSKGNLIQMTAEKMVSGQPPPLIVTGNANAAEKMTSKPQQRLVKIAPLASRTGQAAMHQQTRSGKSLLAPLSPAAEGPTTLDDVTELLQRRELTEVVDRKPQIDHIDQDEYGPGEGEGGSAGEELIDNRETDSKAALQRLIAETVGGVTPDHSMSIREVEVDFERTRSPSCDGSGRSPERNRRQDEHPLIVIPSYMKQDMNLEDDGLRRMNNDMLEVDVETYNNQYHSPQTPRALSDSEILSTDLGLRLRKACNCTKSQCLKLYCDCFANGEFCHRCNCNNCHNNIENEELRQKAIRGCLDRNPNAFRPKIGKSKTDGPEIVRRHNKGCNCKRSGCLKNYCECYEAKIACTYICKCVGCRNVEETLERARRRDHAMATMTADTLHAAADAGGKQPCSFMTTEVIEAVCQCLIAAAVDKGEGAEPQPDRDPTRDVIEEFARCLQDIISAAHHTAPASLLDEAQA